MTKIYTKKGDSGESFIMPLSNGTASADRKMVKTVKHDIGFDVLGDLDELNASIGIIEKTYGYEFLRKTLETLMELGTQLATGSVRLTPDDIKYLENQIDTMTETLPKLKNFILPSMAPEVHLARAICRRLERGVSKWCYLHTDVRFIRVLPYLNRLSDYLFTLARVAGKRDDLWVSRR